MKASDITDEQIYELVAAATFNNGRPAPLMSYNACAALPQFPEKVVEAKLRQMVKHGRLRGCTCGCRGDYRFPWEEFGFGPYELRSEWRRLIADYLAGKERAYGY